MSIPRRSDRKTKGIPPERFEDIDGNMQKTYVSSHTSSIHEKTNSKVESKLTKSSSSRRKLLEIELKEARKLAEIERRKAEIDAEMIRKEAQLQRELINEGSSKKSTISGAESIFNLKEMTIQEKVDNWKTEETENNHVPTTTNFITMTAENLNEICNALKVNSDKVKYTDRTESFKYKLPIFDGNPEDWPIFQSQFERSTKIFNISDEENIIRLQKCLKGRARDTVQPLLVAPENVKKILETLKITFGRPEFIISNLIDKVRRATPPKEGKFETYLPFSNVVENLVTTMELFNTIGHMTNPSILNEIVMKLPPFLRLKWAEEISLEANVTLKTFSVWMRKIAIAASSCTDLNFLNFPEKKVCENDKFQYRKSVNIFSTKKFDSKCPCCQRNHLLADCQNFKKIDIDEKWKLVTSKKLCFNCLKPSHNIYSCRVKQKCGIDNCQKFHNNILHKVGYRKQDEEQIVNPQNMACEQEDNVERINFFQDENPTILLRIIPVKLRGKIKEISTFALLDEAATTSMIDNKIAQEIGLDGPVESLCYQWLNNVTKNEENSKRVSLEIAGMEKNSKIYKMNNVRTVSGLSLPRQTIDVEKMSEIYPYIKKTPVHSFCDAQPTILIGQDQCALTIARNIYQSYWNAPFVSKTLLGWVVHGRYPQGKEVSENSLIFHVCCKSQEEIHEDISKLVKDSFKIENFGIKCLEENGRSKEDDRAIEIMENTIKRVGNHFEIGLLWKNENVTLPDSRAVAINRLKCMERKMDKNENFAADYCKKIEEYLRKGYVRKLSTTETEKEDPKTWYLPHFGVVNPNKPGKLRLVFDAAAKSNGISLNDQLLQGPDLLQNLTSILWKFRQKEIAFCSDIREMFHQVLIRDEDCSAQRFLWRGMERTKEPDVYQMKAMTFGATSSPSMAQFVKNRNAEEHYQKYPEAAKAIIEKHYVDDYLDSTETEEEAIQLISEVIEIHRKAGFEICNWISNSQKVIDNIPEQLISQNQKNVNVFLHQPAERVLGLWWNPETDNFTFSLNFRKIDSKIMEKMKIPTKREILRVVMSVFDPLGFLSPLVIKFKIFMQHLWKCGIDWDDQISEDMNTRWMQLLEELKKIEEIHIPRCYGPQLYKSRRVELHGFCDSSEKAFSAVVYLRFINQDIFQISFVSAKTRVAPMKPITILRLELQAAVMLSRLVNTIKENLEIEINKIYLWTDSKIVLHWIRSNSKRYKTFVTVRVGEITDITEVDNWHWVPGEQNVADESTREVNSAGKNEWLTGPKFLRFPEDEWPKEIVEEVEENELEMRKQNILLIAVEQNYLPNIERFSKYGKLVRATAWMFRFIGNCRKEEKTTTYLEVSELDRAEEMLVKYAQNISFAQEVSDLKNKESLEKSSRLYTVTPFLDEKGILRIKGRLEQSDDLNFFQKHPAILDPKHRLTKLLIENYHVRFGHQGQELIMNEIRQKFWILKLRSAVRKCKNECFSCKKRNIQPHVPEMGQLPECRLQSFVRPFTVTGMDYFGPISVTIGRRHEKRYIVLFTCMSVRAIHLEIANSLNTDSAIMAVRRFVSRRGCPKEIHSDNGTNMHSADRELREAAQDLDSTKFFEFMSLKGITWRFIPPSSPHMGGSWERLVRSVKDVLKVTLRERHPKEEVLKTLIAEAENIVNSRPLSYVSSDSSDPESLTPNHFLLNCSNGAAPPTGKFEEVEVNLKKQWRASQALADIFWRKWKKEYLLNLNRQTKWYAKNDSISVDDIVLVIDDTLQRNMWPLGKVQKVYEGKDGKVRVVDVKTKAGIYKRPVVKICKLLSSDGT